MSHEIELCGCLTIPDNANFDEITDVFLGFVESHGWYYGGGFSEIRDGCYVKPDVTSGDPIYKSNKEKDYGT
jgi:hypothetical protein|nr:MAG TPA: protein of unknown function DUF469 [Caudoviricetes sp.]